MQWLKRIDLLKASIKNIRRECNCWGFQSAISIIRSCMHERSFQDSQEHVSVIRFVECICSGCSLLLAHPDSEDASAPLKHALYKRKFQKDYKDVILQINCLRSRTPVRQTSIFRKSNEQFGHISLGKSKCLAMTWYVWATERQFQ